jgi:hypothetical protein
VDSFNFILLYHEDVWEIGGIAPPFLNSAKMEVGGQIHDTVALRVRKELAVHIEQEAGWNVEPV